ncbi:MAG: hypothetical protein ACM3ZE_15085, partial [Myxococcales bacterium]
VMTELARPTPIAAIVTPELARPVPSVTVATLELAHPVPSVTIARRDEEAFPIQPDGNCRGAGLGINETNCNNRTEVSSRDYTHTNRRHGTVRQRIATTRESSGHGTVRQRIATTRESSEVWNGATTRRTNTPNRLS